MFKAEGYFRTKSPKRLQISTQNYEEISVRIFDRILGRTGSVNGSRGGVPVSLPKVMEQGVTGATREIRARHTEMTLLGMTPSHPWGKVTTGARTTLG